MIYNDLFELSTRNEEDEMSTDHLVKELRAFSIPLEGGTEGKTWSGDGK